jgi:hypothetical protein
MLHSHRVIALFLRKNVVVTLYYKAIGIINITGGAEKISFFKFTCLLTPVIFRNRYGVR